MVTLQYALKRGIETVFQLEEAELAAEPLPNDKRRKAILFYEAAEGGAGVLARLASDSGALARVARKALEICHYSSRSGSWANFEDLVDRDPGCEAGCYRCLLSYYNQPDHGSIDRRDRETLEFLCRLSRATGRKLDTPRSAADTFAELRNAATSSLERQWLQHLKEHGYRLPDRAQPYLQAFNTRPDFAYEEKQVLIYVDGPHHEADAQKRLDAELTQKLEDGGFTVIRFPADVTRWPAIFAEYAWVFGPGRDEPVASRDENLQAVTKGVGVIG